MNVKEMTDDTKITVDDLFRNARSGIKAIYDPGEHPELVTAHVQAAAICFATLYMADELRGLIEVFNKMAENLRSVSVSLDAISLAIIENGGAR